MTTKDKCKDKDKLKDLMDRLRGFGTNLFKTFVVLLCVSYIVIMKKKFFSKESTLFDIITFCIVSSIFLGIVAFIYPNVVEGLITGIGIGVGIVILNSNINLLDDNTTQVGGYALKRLNDAVNG